MTPVAGFRVSGECATDTMSLDALSLDDVQVARKWRNTVREGLRTPHLLTESQQEDFYQSIVCDSSMPMRYWAVRHPGHGFVGMVGLVDIAWEAGIAEISLITDPALRGQGIGSGALELLLHEGFDNMGLRTIYGECYKSNPALGFWERMAERRGAYTTTLPRRKLWGGKLWDSLYFSFTSPHDEGVMGLDAQRGKGTNK
jgi:RimJ/RimL family protein N-acetyltransferase